jgi:hypothetical protein
MGVSRVADFEPHRSDLYRDAIELIRSNLVTLNTIALELVPPNVERGPEYALEEARKVVRISADSGLEGRIRHVMIPGMIAEDDDRPVPMKPKLDVLDFWSIIKPELPGVRGLCTQVTAFMDESSLGRRLTTLGDAGFEGIVFVGVPRTMNDGEGSGVAPTDALSIYDRLVGNRGVILIPTEKVNRAGSRSSAIRVPTSP